ncbi:ParB/RepB/Spo0J family partition protein [Piscinibacter sakaiensis]|uniref:ParB/RepB/Spo0J family partition protein n=1 Tax=Piscinibacter sakaiensis TaxID=1547922 RepID=UPI003AAA90B4
MVDDAQLDSDADADVGGFESTWAEEIFRERVRTRAEIEELRVKLERLEGTQPVQILDPTAVRAGPLVNRHPDSFQAPDFAELKTSIGLTKGNVQPILVKRSEDTNRFEIVYGHRRHRACQDLNLPLKAVVVEENLSPSEAFLALEFENRNRAGLRPFEQAMMYSAALKAELFASKRDLAKAIGVSHTWINQVLKIADLPEEVIQAFKSPLEIQPSHAAQLARALEKNREAVVFRTTSHVQAKTPSAREVVSWLTRGELVRPEEVPIRRLGTIVGSCRRTASGDVVIKMSSEACAGQPLEEFANALERSLVRQDR